MFVIRDLNMARHVFFCILVAFLIVTVLGASFDQGDQDDDDDFVERVRRAAAKKQQRGQSKNKKSGNSSACSSQDFKPYSACCRNPLTTLFDEKEFSPKKDSTTLNLAKSYFVNKLMSSTNKVNFHNAKWTKWSSPAYMAFDSYFRKNQLLLPDGKVNVDETTKHMAKYADPAWVNSGKLWELCEACRTAGAEMPHKQSGKIVRKATKSSSGGTTPILSVSFVQCVLRKSGENCPNNEKNENAAETCSKIIAKMNTCDKDGAVITEDQKKEGQAKFAIYMSQLSKAPAAAPASY